MQQGPPPMPKGNVQALLARLGVKWNPAEIVWDTYNPHPDLSHLPAEVVFVGKGNQNPAAFNESSAASRALQEVVFLYPGHVEAAEGGGFLFEPLIETGVVSGMVPYFQLVQRSFFGVQIAQGFPHRPDDRSYIVAARVTSMGTSSAPAGGGEGGPGAGGAEPAADTGGGGKSADGGPNVDVIVVADLDFISEQFFQIREVAPGNLNFDNVTFILNAMDVLAGDSSFIDLRNRRVKHRTLRKVEEQTRRYIEQRAADEKQAEEEADKALAEAQSRLDAKVAEVRNRADLDEQTKQIMARNLQEAESRRFEVLEANIKLEKEAKIARSKETVESQLLRIQNGIRTAAVLLPPVPVFLLGVAIFIRRRRLEREGAAAAHRLRS